MTQRLSMRLAARSWRPARAFWWSCRLSLALRWGRRSFGAGGTQPCQIPSGWPRRSGSFSPAGWGAQTGGAIGANGGPLVGQSVGAVMPLTNWSLSGGDYRIAHFLGIHAMQALPLIALAFMAIFPAAVASALLLPVAAGWAALTFAVLSRAGAGLPPL